MLRLESSLYRVLLVSLGAGFFNQLAVSVIALVAVIALNISLEGHFFAPSAW